MIIFDTETTGLVKPLATPLKDQPQIIEFAGIKLDDVTLEEVGRLEFLCNPGKPLPEEIIKITGIVDVQLKGKPPFGELAFDLANFFLGERISIAHNHAFDANLMFFELQRLDLVRKFPWPIHNVCTVEQTMHIKGRRMKLSELHKHYFGEEFKDAHRAMVDVEALVRVVKEAIKRGDMELPQY